MYVNKNDGHPAVIFLRRKVHNPSPGGKVPSDSEAEEKFGRRTPMTCKVKTC